MKPKPLGKYRSTQRGFKLLEFKDYNDHPCSLQASSLAVLEKPGTSAVWLGPDEADPRVLASQAGRFGVMTGEATGWVPYPIPDDVLLTTRMHLNREQVASLIAHLQQWLAKDTFEL